MFRLQENAVKPKRHPYSQERYFRVMLGVDQASAAGGRGGGAGGGGGATFDEFVGAIKESRAAGMALVAQRDDEAGGCANCVQFTHGVKPPGCNP